jgi:type II secretory ATPase GspE/PulE/Tfp pilus assembly ATPase PilB-like protein
MTMRQVILLLLAMAFVGCADKSSHQPSLRAMNRDVAALRTSIERQDSAVYNAADSILSMTGYIDDEALRERIEEMAWEIYFTIEDDRYDVRTRLEEVEDYVREPPEPEQTWYE